MKTSVGLLMLLSLLLSFSTSAIEIRVYPKNKLYTYSNSGLGTQKDLYSAIIHNVAIINPQNSVVTIDRVEIQVMKKGNIVQSKNIYSAALNSFAKTYSTYDELGYLKLYDFQFQTHNFMKDIEFSENRQLEKDQGLLITQQALLFDTQPDEIIIIAIGKGTKGNTVQAKTKVEIASHQSQNFYDFPLKGRWYIAGAPSLNSHHRWGIVQEFAFDLVKLKSNSATRTEETPTQKPESFFAFGEPVHAVADGTVVAIVNDIPESKILIRDENETQAQFEQRDMENQNTLLSKGFKYAMGNSVILKHANNEYSYYLHLKKGSVVVKAGDRVEKGQKIGEVGQSGNSTEPHLHFHLADGPDMLNSRSLPIAFENIVVFPDELTGSQMLQYGNIVTNN